MDARSLMPKISTRRVHSSHQDLHARVSPRPSYHSSLLHAPPHAPSSPIHPTRRPRPAARRCRVARRGLATRSLQREAETFATLMASDILVPLFLTLMCKTIRIPLCRTQAILFIMLIEFNLVVGFFFIPNLSLLLAPPLAHMLHLQQAKTALG